MAVATAFEAERSGQVQAVFQTKEAEEVEPAIRELGLRHAAIGPAGDVEGTVEVALTARTASPSATLAFTGGSKLIVAVRAALRARDIHGIKTKIYWIPGRTGLDERAPTVVKWRQGGIIASKGLGLPGWDASIRRPERPRFRDARMTFLRFLERPRDDLLSNASSYRSHSRRALDDTGIQKPHLGHEEDGHRLAKPVVRSSHLSPPPDRLYRADSGKDEASAPLRTVPKVHGASGSGALPHPKCTERHSAGVASKPTPEFRFRVMPD